MLIFSIAFLFNVDLLSANVLPKAPDKGLEILRNHPDISLLFFMPVSLSCLDSCFRKEKDAEATWKFRYRDNRCKDTVEKMFSGWTTVVSQLKSMRDNSQTKILSMELLNILYENVIGTGREHYFSVISTGDILPISDISVIDDHLNLYKWVSMQLPFISEEPYIFSCMENIEKLSITYNPISFSHVKNELTLARELFKLLTATAADEILLDHFFDDLNKKQKEIALLEIFQELQAERLAVLLERVLPNDYCTSITQYYRYGIARNKDSYVQIVSTDVYRKYNVRDMSEDRLDSKKKHYFGLKSLYNLMEDHHRTELLSSLLDQYNRNLDCVKKEDDIIREAANFMWEFINLHILPDGNGRIGRILSNYILLSYGLSPVVADKRNIIKKPKKAFEEEFHSSYISEQINPTRLMHGEAFNKELKEFREKWNRMLAFPKYEL